MYLWPADDMPGISAMTAVFPMSRDGGGGSIARIYATALVLRQLNWLLVRHVMPPSRLINVVVTFEYSCITSVSETTGFNNHLAHGETSRRKQESALHEP